MRRGRGGGAAPRSVEIGSEGEGSGVGRRAPLTNCKHVLHLQTAAGAWRGGPAGACGARGRRGFRATRRDATRRMAAASPARPSATPLFAARGSGDHAPACVTVSVLGAPRARLARWHGGGQSWPVLANYAGCRPAASTASAPRSPTCSAASTKYEALTLFNLHPAGAASAACLSGGPPRPASVLLPAAGSFYIT